MDFETEEQQVEALKKWWKENASTVIAGVILGIAVIVGVRFYSQYKIQHAEEAGAIFYSMINLADSDLATDVQQKVDTLFNSYADTPYASMSALMAAKQQLKKGDFDNAIKNLQWIVDHSSQTELQHIARLRLMRILFANNNIDKALQLSQVDYPQSYAAMYEELKGDLYVAQGDYEQARMAYNKAILNAGAQASQWLRLKRDDLGPASTAEPSA